MIRMITFIVGYILTFALLSSGQNICDNKDYVYKVPGDIVIIGLFDLHTGENCSAVNPVGIDNIKSVIEIVHFANSENYIPGILIGLIVYDTCSQQDIIQKSIVSALVEAECMEAFVLGAITDTPLQYEAANLSDTLHLPVTVLQDGYQAYKILLLEETIRLISYNGANWLKTIDYFMVSDFEKEITELFLEMSMHTGICVKKRINISESLSNAEPKSTVLVLAKYDEIQELIKYNPFGLNFILVPLDGIYEPLEDLKTNRLLIVLPSKVELSTSVNTTLFENLDEEFLTTSALTVPSTKTFRHVQLFSDLMNFLGQMKDYILKHCKQLVICQNLPKIRTNLNLPQINSTTLNKLAKLLNIKMEINICTLMEQTTEGKLINSTLKNKEILSGENSTVYFVKDGITSNNNCINFAMQDNAEQNQQVIITASSIHLRNDSWVAALLSVCAVGITCCLAISAFIVVRLCKGDMLEGNPGFSFLMLFSMIIMYSAVLPYSFDVVDDHHYYKGVICGIKAIGTSLSYSLVYSVMLARSVMLASCDEDGGFMSHVNGYLQTVLCFFIAAVQIALTLQFWAVNWLILTKEQCTSMTEGPLFLYLLGYDMFLLFLLLCMSPFIMRSKRNYHEGGYFAVSTYLCLFVWIGWTTGYALLPTWADLFVCVGLMATASVVLISVFIPRTYLMLTGIVRDHIVSTLPHSLSHTTATSVLDVNYRSTQALYDSVNTGGILQPGGLLQTGQVNPNYYAERPTTPSTSKMEDRIVSDGSNLYERYDVSPSPPLNVTRF